MSWLTPTLEIDLANDSSADVFIIGESLIGYAILGPDVVWNSISADDIRSIRTRSSTRQREIGQFDAGTCEVVLDNFDGTYSKENPDSPFYRRLRAGQPLRIMVDANGVTYPLFLGFISSIEETFPLQFDSVVTITARDVLTLLADSNKPASDAQGAGENAGSRIIRILDNAGFPGWLGRNIEAGYHTMQATTMAQNALGMAKLTADSEGGLLYADKDGSIVFRNKYSHIVNERSYANRLTFGDAISINDAMYGFSYFSQSVYAGSDFSGGATALPYTSVGFSNDNDFLVNFVTLARAEGTEQTIVDNASRSLYRDRTYMRNDLVCETDTQVESLARKMVRQFSQPVTRATHVNLFTSSLTEAEQTYIYDLSIRDRVVVNYRNTRAATPYGIIRECYIDGIEHTILPQQWYTTFYFSEASTDDFFTIGESALGDETQILAP